MEKYLKILEKFKGKSVGIFVDEANLFYSQKDLGWHVDWQGVDDVLSHKKGFIFVCFEHNVAWEIRRSYHLFFEDIKKEIEYSVK